MRTQSFGWGGGGIRLVLGGGHEYEEAGCVNRKKRLRKKIEGSGLTAPQGEPPL